MMTPYKVEHYDGSNQSLLANTISENRVANADEEEHRNLLLDSIIDISKSSSAAAKEDAFVKSSNDANCRA